MTRIDYGEILAGTLAVGWGLTILAPMPGDLSNAWESLPILPPQAWGALVATVGAGHIITPFLAARWAYGRKLRRAFAAIGAVLWATAAILAWVVWVDSPGAWFYAAFAALAGWMFGGIAWGRRGHERAECTGAE